MHLKSKKIILLFLLSLTVFGCSSLLSHVVASQNTGGTAVTLLQPTSSGEAQSQINITLDENSMQYERETFVTDIDTPMGFELIRYNAYAIYTTHEDILLNFHMEFNTTLWNGNFTLFNNSQVVRDYELEYIAIQHLTFVEVELLDVGPEMFIVQNGTFFDPENPTEEKEVFFIDQRVVIRETTAFLLSLDEPFRFDLNEIKLGQIQDMQLEVFFDKDHGVYDERLRLSAEGSPLDSVTSTNGLSGVIRLSEDFSFQEVPKFNRAFGSVNQTIRMQFTLPAEQTLTYFFTYGDFAAEIGLFATDVVEDSKNSMTLEFTTDDWMPVGIAVSTFIPFWEQITLTEWVSYIGSGIIALFTVIKGIPFFLRWVRLGQLRKHLYKAARSKDYGKFNDVMKYAQEVHLKRKITADQYRSLLFERTILKPQFSTSIPA